MSGFEVDSVLQLGSFQTCLPRKFNSVAALPWLGSVNMATDALYVFLTNTLPAATAVYYSDLETTELYYGLPYPGPSIGQPGLWRNGYPPGGFPLGSVTTSLVINGGTMAPSTFTPYVPGFSYAPPVAQDVGPFQYLVCYDQTAAGQPLLGYWDTLSPITLCSVSSPIYSIVFQVPNGLFNQT